MRRRALLLLPVLAGCGLLPEERAPQSDARIPSGTPALVAVAGPRQAVLTQQSEEGARRLWRGGGLAVATEGARITATAGFGQLYAAVRTEGADPLAARQADPRALLGQEVALRRLFDLSAEPREPATMRFGLSVECRLRGREAGLSVLVEERCQGAGLDFTNRFWFDRETGALRRADQWVGDEVPPLTIEPAGSPAGTPAGSAS